MMPSSSLIQKAADLMREQAAAYRHLDSTSKQLSGALARGAPEVIESLVRAGESELLRMRSRLVQIMGALSAFADARAKSPEHSPISSEARAAFEAASAELLNAARSFQRTHPTAASLATSGSSFASAYIETCGVPPTTYRGPYTRRGEATIWA